MGVWARGPSATSIDIPGIAEAMRPTLEAWMTGQLRFYNPQRSTAGEFDPVTNTGGTATAEMIWDTGVNSAIIQPIRSPSRVDVGGQATGLLGIRFQVKHDSANMPTEELRSGVLIEVVNGGNAIIPNTWRFGLGEAIDSSLMWDRIFDAVLITGG